MAKMVVFFFPLTCRLSEHKRLDYVVEHQVLATSSETYDIEVTMVPLDTDTL